MRFAGEMVAGLPEVVDQIERRRYEEMRMQMEMERRRQEERMSPEYQFEPYNPLEKFDPNKGTGQYAMMPGARNLREPFPMRQDINRPLDTIPTHPIIGPDGKDKFPGFEIRSVMPRVWHYK